MRRVIKHTDIKDFQREVFCVTGIYEKNTREVLLHRIESRDGEYTQRINKSTTVVVLGFGPGKRTLEKAEKYNIPFMDQAEFELLLQSTPIIDHDADRYEQFDRAADCEERKKTASKLQEAWRSKHSEDEPSSGEEEDWYEEDILEKYFGPECGKITTFEHDPDAEPWDWSDFEHDAALGILPYPGKHVLVESLQEGVEETQLDVLWERRRHGNFDVSAPPQAPKVVQEEPKIRSWRNYSAFLVFLTIFGCVLIHLIESSDLDPWEKFLWGLLPFALLGVCGGILSAICDDA